MQMLRPSASSTRTSNDRTIDARIEAALARARAALVTEQREDGSWNSVTDIGPIGLATQVMVEALLGALPPADEPLVVAAFARDQRPDGSFGAYPHASSGSVTVTALAWAALVACRAGDTPIASRARAYVDANGGMEAVARAFRERSDMAALYLVARGHLDAALLPRLPAGAALAPLGAVLSRRVHSGNVMVMLVLAAVGERFGASKSTGFLASARRALEQIKVRDELLRWQNADGSWNGSPLQTTLMLLGLHASGMTSADAPVQRALTWLDGMKRRGTVLDVCAMDNDVWSTALFAMALHAAGEDPEDDVLSRATSHLLRTQGRTPMPKENQRKAGARRTGGWPFQCGNETMPDTDDTGVVLAALADLGGRRAARELYRAMDDGVHWLRDMQNADGGFPTFVWGLPSKSKGPMFIEDLRMDLEDPRKLASAFTHPLPEYGDPSLEGVTGRVLWGLGRAGVSASDPAVQRAIAFLREQQCESGAWWGRWKACYLAETATILLGLGAVGEDMTAAYVQRALGWILECQNVDGGFGELPDAYRDPRLAGRGPSMPPVTAYVVLGCLATGQAPDAAMSRAVEYLLAEQREDGLWDNAGWLHTFIPPDLMYVYDAPALALPVLALAEYRRRRVSRAS